MENQTLGPLIPEKLQDRLRSVEVECVEMRECGCSPKSSQSPHVSQGKGYAGLSAGSIYLDDWKEVTVTSNARYRYFLANRTLLQV
jgi:hypothetical protein